MPPNLRTWSLPNLCITIPLGVGMLGSFFTVGSIPGWYAGLNKSSLNPPAWVFGPVWTVIYIVRGISLYLFIRQGLERSPIRQGVTLFAAQLVLNLFWSIVFFGIHAITPALAVLPFLIVLIAATAIQFGCISGPAAWLLVPYLVWCCFAAVLNAEIWLLNMTLS